MSFFERINELDGISRWESMDWETGEALHDRIMEIMGEGVTTYTEEILNLLYDLPDDDAPLLLTAMSLARKIYENGSPEEARALAKDLYKIIQIHQVEIDGDELWRQIQELRKEDQDPEQ